MWDQPVSARNLPGRGRLCSSSQALVSPSLRLWEKGDKCLQEPGWSWCARAVPALCIGNLPVALPPPPN